MLRDLRAVRLLVPLGLALLATAARAGDPAPDLPREVRGLDGARVALKAPERGATVVVFYSSECPISNAYSPTLNALVDAHGRALNLVGACVDPDLGDDELRKHAKEFGLKFPVVRDRGGALARALGATVTPEAFLLDDKGAVRYSGRIDDQFAARGRRKANRQTHELEDALAAVLAGKPVAVPHVDAVGCPIPHPAHEARAEPPTFHRDVAAILQKHCQECHRPGQVGPFALMSYDQARKRADDIARVADDRQMPPWKPAPGFGVPFAHDKSLTADEIATLAAWAEAGAPEGDPKDAPPAPSFAEGWALGTPDLILEPVAEYAVPADGDDIYRCFVIPTDLPRDVDIAAIEYQPGNRRVVHHLLSYVDTSGEGRKKAGDDPHRSYSCFSGPGVEVTGDLGGWAPGNEAKLLPDGIGRRLPKGADVVMQVHYHPSGKPETDRTRMGLYFCKKPMKQAMHWTLALNQGLRLEPNKANIEITAEMEMPIDLVAYAVTPHMHLLGRDMTMSLAFPDGRTQDLIRIDDWDFNWQNSYYFKEPIDVPKGTVLKVVAHYDNTEDNPRNPNRPPKLVTWGEATTDEMCVGFLAVTKKGQDLTRPGEKDDLTDIFHEHYREIERKMKEAREKAENEKRADRAGSD